MIEIRRSDHKIIRADPISPKDQERAWIEYIRQTGYGAIKHAMEEQNGNSKE